MFDGKKLGFGAMRLPLLDPADPAGVDLPLTCRMVDEFIDRGFTYFDTAWMYCGGRSEEFMGKALVQRHRRESYTLASKLPGYMIEVPEDRDRIFATQLQRTGAGYFDYYLLHDINAVTLPNFDKQGCWDWIANKRAKGEIRHMGFSFHDTPEMLDRLLAQHPEMEFVQLQINYLDWESLGVQSRACYEVARRHGKPIIVMEPIKGGTLANLPPEAAALFEGRDPSMSPASWAIRFAASLPGVEMVLSGMSTLEQLLDNTGYMADFVPLTGEEAELCKRAAEIINSTIAIPCTGCSYCTVNCPKDIAIPQYFSLYNADLQEIDGKPFTAQENYYANVSAVHGRPGDCIKCGRCESMCPQHLKIRELLQEVARHFEG